MENHIVTSAEVRRERELPLTLVTEESQEAGGQEAGGRLGRRRKYYSSLEQHFSLVSGRA